MTSGYFSPKVFAVNQTNGKETSSIGFGSMSTSPSGFDGLIDQLSISYYVKNK